ncbi:hypothetical protein [endosymbiont GvMRE of Glomus versiforme]|uniref:hypothetical protein n=1 Tax=endosymbiont GvMRE of Glomus versiforme TaxID=2039283 RepID=UPI000EBA7717|nr:hypothetical protein [endosymbiont GvMRE of Glomus versiforme]RHZ36335.1 hypothetical protein GvMRE_Ic1g132 [endosymbiont GvMRE of Glomus versiforme]
MNRLSTIRTKQEFLQQLRTKIRNQEISEKEVISLLGEKKTNSLKQTNKCRFCGQSLILQESKESKKANHQTTWDKEFAKLPKQEQKEIREMEKVMNAFDKARIKH